MTSQRTEPTAPEDAIEETSARGSRSLGVAAALLLFVAVMAIDLLVSLPSLDLATRELRDTDGYMRMVRVTELRDGTVGWFESIESRSNAPYGHSMHWTRPLDVLVLALASVPDLWTSSDEALYAAGTVVSPLLLGATAVAIAWAALALVDLTYAFLAGVGVALQPALLAYGAAGRVDHHLLLVLMFAFVTGTWLRIVSRDRPPLRRSESALGLLLAAGVWVSPEFLLVVALIQVGLVIDWIWAGSDLRSGVRVSAAWLLGQAAALLVERGKGALVVEYDRISIVHALVAAGVLAYWSCLALVVMRVQTRTGRGVAALAAASVPITVVVAAFPRFLRGPFADVPRTLWDAWLSRVVELGPLWPLGSGLPRSLYLVGSPCIAVVVWMVVSAKVPAIRVSRAWYGVGLLTIAMTAVAIGSMRFAVYAEALASVPIAVALAIGLRRGARSPGLKAMLARVAVMTASVSAFLVPAVAASAVAGHTNRLTASQCPLAELASTLDAVDAGGTPVVLANVDFGPEILYRTRAAVVAAPYHRNVRGILDTRDAFSADPRHALGMLQTRGIDAIVVCPSRDLGFVGPVGDESLLRRLIDGPLPEFVRRLHLPAQAGDLALYQVMLPKESDGGTQSSVNRGFLIA